MDKEKISGIYCIWNKESKKIYIGSSIDVERRKIEHFNHLKKNKHYNEHLQRSYNFYGVECFDFLIIERVENVDQIFKREKYWIEYYNSINPDFGYNILPPFEEGYRQSEEIKNKISKSHLGVPLSEEHKKGLVKGWETRQPTTQETKDKMKESWKHRSPRKPLTEQQRKNLSDAHKGIPSPFKGIRNELRKKTDIIKEEVENGQ